MILNFGDKETEKVWQGEFSRKLPIEIQQIARRKLRMIHRSQDIVDLIIPPSNHLEKLKGNLEGYYSIRINKKWRIIFKWNRDCASMVKIIDYHK